MVVALFMPSINIPLWKDTDEGSSYNIGSYPSLLLIIIVIGGIVAGIFTATEGAGICVNFSA